MDDSYAWTQGGTHARRVAPGDAEAVEAAAAAFPSSSSRVLRGREQGEGHAEQVRELPLDAELSSSGARSPAVRRSVLPETRRLLAAVPRRGAPAPPRTRLDASSRPSHRAVWAARRRSRRRSSRSPSRWPLIPRRPRLRHPLPLREPRRAPRPPAPPGRPTGPEATRSACSGTSSAMRPASGTPQRMAPERGGSAPAGGGGGRAAAPAPVGAAPCGARKVDARAALRRPHRPLRSRPARTRRLRDGRQPRVQRRPPARAAPAPRADRRRSMLPAAAAARGDGRAAAARRAPHADPGLGPSRRGAAQPINARMTSSSSAVAPAG